MFLFSNYLSINKNIFAIMKKQVFSKYLYLLFINLLNSLNITVYKGYAFPGKPLLNFYLYLDLY